MGKYCDGEDRGEMLCHGWSTRTAESKERILSQLKEMVNEMRDISYPEDMDVANVNGGTLYDCRLPGT
jgi:Trm5-related predicted tRNA methylase